MDGLSFLNYVKRVFKRTDKDTEIYEATTDVIADIRLQLKTEDYKEEAFVSLGVSPIGDYRIAVPNDFGHIIGELKLVDNSNGYTRNLKKISKQTYDELYSDRLLASTSNVNIGIPIHFCIYAEQIFLGPVPDSTSYIYHMNYTTENYTEVTSATDPVPFTERYRAMLRAGVLAEVYMGLEAFDESDYWKQTYLDGLLKLKANDDGNTSDTEGVVYHGI